MKPMFFQQRNPEIVFQVIFYIFNPAKNRKPKNIADFHHNPLHAKALKERADSLKIKNVVYAPGIGIIDKSGQGVVDFITENLNQSYFYSQF